MDLAQLNSIAFTISIIVTVFTYGLRARRDDILYVFRRPRLLVVSLLAMFVVMPVIALALELYFGLPDAARVALVVLALSPVPQLLPTNEIASGGRPSYAYGLSFAVALVSIALVPALVNFLGRVMSRPFDLPAGTVAGELLPTVLLPLAVGMLVHRLFPDFANQMGVPMRRIADAVLAIAVIILLVTVLPAVFDVIEIPTLLAMVVFALAGLGVGHVMGGPDPDHSVVLALSCANRNPGIAIAIAAANYPAENFGAMIVLYVIVIGVVSKPYINWQKRRLSAGQVVEQGA